MTESDRKAGLLFGSDRKIRLLWLTGGVLGTEASFLM